MKATKLTIIVLSLFLTAQLNAQIPPPTPPNPGGGTNPTVPITGIEILVALGGLFGVKKVIDFRKKK